jgi:Xaa-Pro aminopeptidase
MTTNSHAHPGSISRRRWLQGATATAVGAPLIDALLADRVDAQTRTPLPEIKAQLPGFSVAERNQRWAKVRANMAAPQWNLDAIITCMSDEWGCDARYLTQVEKVRYSGGGPQVIFPRDPAKTVWVQMGGARHRDEWLGRLNDGGGWLADGKMALLAEEGGSDMAERLAAEGFDRRGTRIGVSALKGSRFNTDGLVSATWLDIVRARLPGVEFLPIDQWGADCGPIVSSAMVKSAEEVAMIRHAVATNQAALAALVEAVGNGATRHDQAWWPAFATMYTANGEDFNRLSIGFDEGGNMTLGEPTVDPIEIGQLCTQEISSAYQGYACQINHTFFVGSPSTPGYDYYRAAIGVLNDIHETAMGFITPGETTYGQLMGKLADLYKAHDVEGGGVALHSGGIGQARPRLGQGPDGEIVIQPGHTFDWKPSATLNRAKVRDARDENRDVQLGESYLVTATGVERFGDRSMEPIATHG